MDDFRNVVRVRMILAHCESMGELARRTGLNYTTLRHKIAKPANLRVYEVQALDNVLHFTGEELTKLLRG